MIAGLVLVVTQLENRMLRDVRGIDLVIGAKRSPMQPILSGIYQPDRSATAFPWLRDATRLQ